MSVSQRRPQASAFSARDTASHPRALGRLGGGSRGPPVGRSREAHQLGEGVGPALRRRRTRPPPWRVSPGVAVRTGHRGDAGDQATAAAWASTVVRPSGVDTIDRLRAAGGRGVADCERTLMWPGYQTSAGRHLGSARGSVASGSRRGGGRPASANRPAAVRRTAASGPAGSPRGGSRPGRRTSRPAPRCGGRRSPSRSSVRIVPVRMSSTCR